jgi:uncharacterized membrane protein
MLDRVPMLLAPGTRLVRLRRIFIAMTLLILAVLYRRDFRSKTLDAIAV